MPSTPTNPGDARSGRWWRIAGLAVGVLLIAAAVRAVWSNGAALETVRESLAAAPGGRLVLLAVLPLASWLLTSGVFLCLTRARAKVGAVEMSAMVGASWLLNYLPLSPGLLGRVAYQKAALGIPFRTSARIVVESIGLGVLGGGVLLGDLALSSRIGVTGLLGLVLLPLTLVAWLLHRRGAAGGLVPAYATSLLLKYVDTLGWALRYWTVFAVLGVPLSGAQAVAIALVAQVSMLVPGMANGLGLREWVVGVVAANLPAWSQVGTGASEAGASVPVALAADMALRVCEVGMAIPVGVISVAVLSRRVAVRS